jgi:hypothetical protein
MLCNFNLRIIALAVPAHSGAASVRGSEASACGGAIHARTQGASDDC